MSTNNPIPENPSESLPADRHGAANSRRGNWGGRRPGAGAPRGNLNALRHGRYSTQHKQLALLLAQIPEAQEALIKLALRRRKRQKKNEAVAAELMAEILRRLGELILSPQHNHLEYNQALLDSVRTLEALIRKIPQTKSR
jgi:hypothetical protein